MQKHSVLFENRYFGEQLGLSGSHIPKISPNSLLDSVETPNVPELSCSDIRRIPALGGTWAFGFPFAHTISDPDHCPDENNGPDHPSTEGSHGDIDAFPSLEGRNESSF